MGACAGSVYLLGGLRQEGAGEEALWSACSRKVPVAHMPEHKVPEVTMIEIMNAMIMMNVSC